MPEPCRAGRFRLLSFLWEKPYAALFVSLCAVALSFFAIRIQSYFGDEGFHIDQIRMFLRKDFRMNPLITMVPGFHAWEALVGYVFNRDSLDFFRFVNLLVSLLSIPVFFWTSRVIDPQASITKTVQYAFFPILFPFFFLLYTDVLSLTLTFAAVGAVIGRRYGLGGLLGIASMLVRQNNVIWFGFLILLFLFQEYGTQMRTMLAAIRKRSLSDAWSVVTRLPWLRILRSSWSFVLGLILFLLFLVSNGGMAIGDSGAHPFPAIHAGNIYFLLLLSYFLFFPLHLSHLRAVGDLITRVRWVIPFLVGFLILYMVTFINDHAYNQDLQSAFFRNRMLVYVTMEFWHMVGAWVLIAYALLSTAVTQFHRREYMLLFPLTVLYLLPSWLIEQRYYLIPFTLFLLLRRNERPAVEWPQALFGIIFTGVLFYMVAERWFFL